jgi:uncharacterized membrane protein
MKMDDSDLHSGGNLDDGAGGSGDRAPENPLNMAAYHGGDATTMAHFYRGEMNRLTIWRTRMDATTNWAILSTIGLLSFSFRNPNADATFIFMIASLWFLLTVESRRYRFYDVWRWRLRILEAHFLVPVVAKQLNTIQGPWRDDLCGDLLYPTFKMSMGEAMGRRLLRNYIYLFGLVLVASLAHVFGVSLATSGWSMISRDHLVQSMEENWLLLCIILFNYIPVVVLALFGWKRRKVIVELHDAEGRRAYRV